MSISHKFQKNNAMALKSQNLALEFMEMMHIYIEIRVEKNIIGLVSTP